MGIKDNNILRNMTISASLLGLFAVTGSGLVAYTYKKTAPAIAEAERVNLLKKLHSVIPKENHDNNLFNDFILVTSPELLGSEKPLPVFRARQGDTNVAAILNAVAPDGYNGDIRILIGVYVNGEIAGVRILDHRETPGLGDAIEERRSDWIHGFSGLSLANPVKAKWKVQRDGGHFDQFTGATITPRAVVKAVHKALQYYSEHKDSIFQKTSLIQETQSDTGAAPTTSKETP